VVGVIEVGVGVRYESGRPPNIRMGVNNEYIGSRGVSSGKAIIRCGINSIGTGD